MLERIVQKFRGAVVLFVVLMLSAVFVLEFGGPQSEGCSLETQGQVATVYDQSISINELRSAYRLAGGKNYRSELARQYKLEQMVLYGLVERDLLAREARRLGFDADQDEVLQKVAAEGLIYLSMSVDAGPFLPPSGPQRFNFEDEDGRFDHENLKNFIVYQLRRSIKEFARSQIQETLAHRMRETIMATVDVSEGEVWDAFVRERDKATLKYARFSPVYYQQTLSPTPEIDAWAETHADAIDAAYERDKHRYTGLEKQVRARHILIKVPAGASEEEKQAARERGEALRQQALDGADFARLAREHSEDEGSAKKGGDLGFNPKGRMVKPFDEAQFALGPGEISDVVESNFGFHVIKVEAIREGDVPVQEAKAEIAHRLYRETRTAELAKQGAEALLSKLAGGMPLAQAEAELIAPDAKAGGTAETGAKSPQGPDASATPPEPDPLAPQFRETRPFGRGDTPIAGPFDASPLVEAAFELTLDDPLPSEPIQLGDDWFVYVLTDRQRAEPSSFTEEEQRRIHEGLVGRKQREVLTHYVHRLLAEASQEGALQVDSQALASIE